MAYVALGTQQLFDPNIAPAPQTGSGTATTSGWLPATTIPTETVPAQNVSTGWQQSTTQAGYTDQQKLDFAKAVAAELKKRQDAAKLLALYASLPKCATSAQHNAAVIDCRNSSVKGLGAMGLGDMKYEGGAFKGADPCWVQGLPICKPPPLLKKKPAVQKQRPPLLGDRKHPTLAIGPTREAAAGGLGMGSILLVLVVAGGAGYFLYKRSKKGAKTAAAA